MTNEVRAAFKHLEQGVAGCCEDALKIIRASIEESPTTSSNKQMAEVLAKAVWVHAQQRPLSWTLESMERAIYAALKKYRAVAKTDHQLKA